MNLPREVTVYSEGEYISISATVLTPLPEEQAFLPQARYLRADLVCGECANHDPSGDSMCYAAKLTQFRAPDDPACMAFEPKEVG